KGGRISGLADGRGVEGRAVEQESLQPVFFRPHIDPRSARTVPMRGGTMKMLAGELKRLHDLAVTDLHVAQVAPIQDVESASLAPANQIVGPRNQEEPG